MWSIGIAVRITPGKARRSGDRNLALQHLVVRLEVPVAHRPVGAQTVLAVDTKIGGVKAGSESGPVHGPSSDTLAAVICTHSQRTVATRNPQIVPVKLV